MKIFHCTSKDFCQKLKVETNGVLPQTNARSTRIRPDNCRPFLHVIADPDTHGCDLIANRVLFYFILLYPDFARLERSYAGMDDEDYYAVM